MTSTDKKELAPLLEAGYELIPLHRHDHLDGRGRERGKSPLHPNWTRRTYRNTEQVEHMERGSNVGVRLRARDLVVDVDPRNFREGVDEFAELVLWLGLDPTDWPHVETGSGGSHYYLTKAQDAPVLDSLAEFPGVEFKTLGRQVVAPGSVHPTTKGTYAWRSGADDLWLGAPTVPEALLDLVRRPERTNGAPAGGGEHTPEELASMLDRLDPEDFRDHDRWLTLMQACHHATAGDGRQEFLDWCAGDPEYADHGAVVGARWDSLHADRADGVTHRTLHKLLRDAGAEDAIPRSAPEDDFEPVSAEDLPEGAQEDGPRDAGAKSPLERMNDRYCCSMIGSQFRVMWRARDPESRYEVWQSAPKEPFFDMLANKRIQQGERTVPLAKAWFEWSGRRQYDGVVFDPDGEHEGYLNLWTGFGVSPDRDASCERLVEMVRSVLCAGDEASFDYLMNWLAWKVQNPGRRNEVAVVLRGEKGVGKTTLGEVMTDIFGGHGFVAKHVDEVAGRFNGHLAQTAFLFGDEVMWGGDREAEGRLKKLITDASTSTERKGQDIQRSTNRVSLMMATNERWAVPVSLEGERRFFVLDVRSDRKAPKGEPDHPNRAYWNELRHELDHGGREAFFALLLDRELPRGWHPRSSVPDTTGLARQIVESLDLVQRWYLEAVQAGELPGQLSYKDRNAAPHGWEDGESEWADVARLGTPRIDPTSVMRELQDYVRRAGSRLVVHQTTLTPFLKEFGWQSRKSNGIVTYRPPTLEAARDAWRQRVGRRQGGDAAIDLFEDGAEEDA